jgi:hypothetical protein
VDAVFAHAVVVLVAFDDLGWHGRRLLGLLVRVQRVPFGRGR